MEKLLQQYIIHPGVKTPWMGWNRNILPRLTNSKPLTQVLSIAGVDV
jgi:hypothetical protein